MDPMLCKFVVENDMVVFQGPTNAKLTLSEQIEDDKKYGIMTPSNGQYFTYKAMDWQSNLISNRQIQRAVTMVWEEIERHLNIDVRKAKTHELPDFKVFFRATADDPLLDKNTLQYHYFPINNHNDPNRGVCVVNTDFPFTVHGNPIDLHFIDPAHYPTVSGSKGVTIDFDQVYGSHEIIHGLGLPHSQNPHKTMSANYGIMAEHFEDEIPQETLPRLFAKYQKRSRLSRIALRWLRWKRRRFDKY